MSLPLSLPVTFCFGTASGPPADLAQAAAQGGSGAAGFQLPRPVRQGICSGVFEADEVGERFWGARLHLFAHRIKQPQQERAEHTTCHEQVVK